MRCRFLFVVGVVALVACVASPSPELLSQADYGTPPTQAEALEAARAHFHYRLFDPYSAIYEAHGVPERGWALLGRDFFLDALTQAGIPHREARSGYLFGYWMRITLNAKNRLGGYVGIRPYRVFIRNGRALAAVRGWP